MATPFKHDQSHYTFKLPITSRVKFPYLTLSQFAKAFKDYIHFGVFGGFKGFIYADYNKGLQTVIQMMETASSGDLIDYGLPLFNYDVQIDGPVKEVDSYWRSSRLFPSIAKRIYDPFYEDNDIAIRIVYRRMHGTIPVTIYCSSQPEEIDIQLAFTDAFQGGNKYIVTPIRTYTVIPDSFIATRVDGTPVTKGLQKDYITRSFISAVNKHCYYIQSNTAPLVKMVSLNPSNTLYGGKDLPQYSLTGSFEFEMEVPQYIMANATNYGNLTLDITLNYQYEYNNQYTLNNIFGKVIYKDTHEDCIVCENGNVIGTNAIIVDTDTLSVLDVDTFYPEPRGFLPTQNDIVIYLDTPMGILTKDKGNFTIEHDSTTGKYTLALTNKVSFQKGDLVGMYIFKPKADSD